jgi:armadillo repeat-containing protein 2
MELYARIKDTKGSWRGAILGALYGLVECHSPKILLAVARVVLGLGVTGSNLTGACKLVNLVLKFDIFWWNWTMKLFCRFSKSLGTK